MSEAREFKYIGQSTIRPDGYDKVTGRAAYGADLTLPGMIWGRILRSPHAHANILSIDTTKAEAHPDVLAVATYADFVEDQDREMRKIEEFYDVKGNFLEENKKQVLPNPDYTKIFTNYNEIETWFH